MRKSIGARWHLGLPRERGYEPEPTKRLLEPICWEAYVAVHLATRAVTRTHLLDA